MIVDLDELPEGMDGRSVVTVSVGTLRSLALSMYVAGACHEAAPRKYVEVGPCPWLGDEGDLK